MTTSIYPVPSICSQDQISDWFASLAECLHWNVRKKQKAIDELSDLTRSSSGKVEKILKGSLDLIQSSSLSVKIQIMGRKVWLRWKGKTLLSVVNKLMKTSLKKRIYQNVNGSNPGYLLKSFLLCKLSLKIVLVLKLFFSENWNSWHKKRLEISNQGWNRQLLLRFTGYIRIPNFLEKTGHKKNSSHELLTLKIGWNHFWMSALFLLLF